jgi:large subunit ribosomal protein L18
MGVNSKSDQRVRRKCRIRKRVTGTQERPRLSVFRSARHIYAQIIAVTDGAVDKKKVDKAVMVGKLVAERAKAKGIAKVVFDRNGFLYHGRVKAVSDGAREAGLDF